MSGTGCSRLPSKVANERLDHAGEVPLPQRLTPHKLRHTFASVLVALGGDPGYVMDQLGHTDPTFTLRVYRHGMRRDPVSREALRQLVGTDDWAATGSNVVPVSFPAAAGGGRIYKNPAISGAFCDAPVTIRTCDLPLRRRTLYPLSYGRVRSG